MTQSKLFYLNCPIGFEGLLLKEIELKYGKLTHTQSKGGVLIEANMDIGLSFNHVLKIPTRVLLRLKEQKCRDLPKLYKILKKIDWKEYLKQENVSFKISSQTFRLNHTKKIENTAVDALKDYFKANQIKSSIKLLDAPSQNIYLRFEDDNLTISLDTSGDRLDEREKQKYRGNASIRETYASALILFLLEGHKWNQALLDPMCGSSTLLQEAMNFWKINEKRKFAYENWTLVSSPFHPELKDKWNITEYIGSEINDEVYQKIKNFEFSIYNEDALKRIDQREQIIISNPPYGKRVKIDMDRKAYFEKLIQKYHKNYSPTLMGIIIPFDIAKSIKAKKRISFNQNGIKVSFLVF